MTLTQNEHNALLEVKSEVTGRFPLTWMKVFGSRVKGNARSESDLDVLFVLDILDWEIERSVYEICFLASVRHDTLISPIVMSRAETESPFTRATPFYQSVEKEGVIL